MNREILFRGKRKDNGEWVEGYLIHNDIIVTDTYMDDYGEIGIIYYEVIPETVCQYTDIKEG